jgi:hypothetical protein
MLESPSRSARLSLFLLSAATLTFEINLTRLFSVAQFYHFAFLIVSLALLGFGASGTALAILPSLTNSRKRPERSREAAQSMDAASRDLSNLQSQRPQQSLSRLSLAAAASLLGAYLVVNWFPFDSFSITWDRRQIVVLVLNLLALAAPFFFSGMAVGLLLSAYPRVAGQVYAVNLAGSAAGCLAALAAPGWVGGEGTATLSCVLAALACLMCSSGNGTGRGFIFLSACALAAFGALDLGLRASGRPTLSPLDLRLSPYKGLSYALQYPKAEVIYRRWNAFSRVDVVRSPGIRSLPGLSYRFLQPPPPQNGLLVDGDDLSPVVLPGFDPAFVDHMPGAIAFRLRPRAEALILEPRGGLDVWVALETGAQRVTAVEINPLIVQAAGSVYQDFRVRVVVESDRSYLRQSREQYDVVVLSLASAYHPVRSGAYSLAEDYRYTVEAFQDAVARLNSDGLLVVTRWLQMPPSEELRAFALAVTALEREGLDPAVRIVALRGYNTGTLLVKKSPFTPEEVDAVRAFAAERAFDLTYAPGLRPDEANQYNILPEPVYYQTFTALLTAPSRERWYGEYPYEVTPPTDDRPFFGHFFKWSQAPQVLAELGKTWQPFGGAGYFVVLALLALAAALAGALILLPVVVARFIRKPPEGSEPSGGFHAAGLIYFGLIGLAFLLVEIPLLQRFILFLGHPAYALTAVLFTLLLFSGIGSQWAARMPFPIALAALAGLVLALPALLPNLFALTLGFSLGVRLAVTVVILAPLGFLMGIPFPRGIQWIETQSPGLIPWLWGVNGAASVVASVLAALLALSFGFRWVLVAGAACYAGAWLTAKASGPQAPAPRPRP